MTWRKEVVSWRHRGRKYPVELRERAVRDECLNINSFWSLTQARVVISEWKDDCNHHRRHSALGYLPPAVYAAT